MERSLLSGRKSINTLEARNDFGERSHNQCKRHDELLVNLKLSTFFNLYSFSSVGSFAFGTHAIAST